LFFSFSYPFEIEIVLYNSIYTIIQAKNWLDHKKNKKEDAMGYDVKIQRVDRGATKSFYINFPAAIAEAVNIAKGEEWIWSIEDRNTFLLRRKKPIKSLVGKRKSA